MMEAANNFHKTLLNILKGKFHDYNKFSDETIIVNLDAKCTHLRYVPSYQLRVFVSSTFTDTHNERNIILDEIVPELREIATPSGIEIVFIDMRYGVRDENTLDHMTWIACKTELNQCLKLSNSIFFLSLQGDKYGYQPIPKFIPQDLYETRYSSLSKNDQTILDQWYRLDTNSIPMCTYVLKNLTDINDPIFWAMQSKIRSILKDIPFDRDYYCNDIVIDRSVTEYEAKYALSNEEDRKRCLWIIREFDNGVPDVRDFNDTFSTPSDRLKLDNLKTLMNDALAPLSNITKNRISYDHFISNDDICKQYLSDFKEYLVNYFTIELNSIITKKQRWLSDSFGLGCKGNDVDEMLHHCKIVVEKCHDFTGRDELMARALDIIFADKKTVCNKFRISLCITGRSGTGKTALMSKLASTLCSVIDNVPVIIRFCGTSGNSINGIDLIKSICKQIGLVYGIEGIIVSDLYLEAVGYFHSLLSQYPVILFIDSLDQLSNNDHARAKISFLDGISSLHEDSRIIVSALSDEPDVYNYMCETTLSKAEVPMLAVKPFNSGFGESKAIITSLLSQKSRMLTSNQMIYFLSQVSVEPTALYFRLAVNVVEKWNSFTEAHELVLTGGVRGLINQLHDTLERDFGSVLVRTVLGLVTFSVGGLSITHIQNLLSLSEKVIAYTFQYSRPNKLQIPIHVISRLLQALRGLVVERDDGKVNWYHRQLLEAAVDRYQSDEKDYRLLLANYFGNLVNESLRKERYLSEQPIVLGECAPWFKKAAINKTACIEGVTHMLKCKDPMMLVQAYKRLCSVDYIYCSCKIGEGFQLVLHLIELERLVTSCTYSKVLFENLGLNYDDVLIRLRHYVRWLHKDMSRISKNPSQQMIATATTQPYISRARIDIESFLHQSFVNNGVSLQGLDSSSNVEVWCRGRCLGGPHLFDLCLLCLSGHDEVISTSFSPDGSKIVSGSADSSVRIWDIITGNELTKMAGHRGDVSSVSFSPDGTKIVSGSTDKSIRIWDVITGNEIVEIVGHKKGVTSVSFSPDGTKIVSGSADNSIRIWDVITGNEIVEIVGHKKGVTSVSFSPDGTKIVSGSADNSIRIWDVITGNEIVEIVGHKKGVTSVSFSPDGTKIVSGSADNSIRIWSAITGGELSKIDIDGHTSSISSASFSPDGSKIVSGSGFGDLSVRIWDSSLGTELYKIGGHRSVVTSVSFSPDGSRVVSGSWDKTIRIWDTIAKSEVRNFDGHLQDGVIVISSSGSVTLVAFSPDGSKVLSGSDDTILIWDAKTERVMHKILCRSAVRSLSFSPDGTKFVSGSKDGSVCIWDTIAGRVEHKMDGHDNCVQSVSFSPDGAKVASGSADNSIRLWNTITGTYSLIIVGHDNLVQSVSFSPDGSKVVSGSYDNSIRIWDSIKGTEILKITLTSFHKWVNSVSFSPDCSKVVSGSYFGSIHVWDATNGSEIRQLIGHSNLFAITTVSFSPDGSKIISGSEDKSIRIWDTITGDEVIVMDGHEEKVTSASFSPDGSKVVSGSADKTIRIWDAIEL